LLVGVATRESAIADVALTVAVLAAFASIAFVRATSADAADTTPDDNA